MSEFRQQIEDLLRKYRSLGRDNWERLSHEDLYRHGLYDAYEHAGNLLAEILNKEAEK